MKRAAFLFASPSASCPTFIVGLFVVMMWWRNGRFLRTVRSPLPHNKIMRFIMSWLRRQPALPLVASSFALLLLLWQIVVWLGAYDKFILPGPLDVARQLGVVLADGRLLRHSLITISELIPGLLLGFLIALPLGYLLAKSPLAERLISPYLIASQAIPVIAIAPLLTIWIHSTYWARVLVAVLVVFFPVLINIIA
ncbi:MAG: hypothetical protein GY805_06905, partial [Chloroflexi bacterium]|nr:hypothetical protein [Chloroflexota bacterium]